MLLKKKERTPKMLAYQIRLHLIVVIFGFTGILGKLIELPATTIVIYRMIIASVTLGIFLYYSSVRKKVSRRNQLIWLATGCVVGLHWFFFFESIKLSTVSVALVSLSSTALFTSILEPLFRRKKFETYELIFSLLIIFGMVIVLRFEFKYALGILYGIICAFLASLFTVMNSKYVIHHPPSLISFYELLGGLGFIVLLSLLFDSSKLLEIPSTNDIIYLLILGIIATAVAFVVSVSVMKKLTAFTVSLTINLEPLYGIILAVLIFGQEELMSAGFYIGFSIIMGTILVNAFLKKRERDKLKASTLQ